MRGGESGLKYVSTRGAAPALEFEDVLLTGLAADGGLYVPMVWPQLSEDEIRNLRGASYIELAYKVIAPFVGSAIPDADLKAIIKKAYTPFAHHAITPLTQLDSQLWLMELFHGPTIAFKDVALQLLGHLFDYILARRQQRLTIIGATSGDTGSAAIAACRGRQNVDIFILHPEGRVSDVQRKQMTTVPDANVFNIAIKGTFDDCQELVKNMFNDEQLKRDVNLGAINSINWARLMAQIVYYFYASIALGAPDRAIGFAVPTGNFGNIYAGYGARQMGLPIARLICGSNANDILTRFHDTGTMQRDAVKPTLSPSMDIQVSSNFERLLFDLCERKGGDVIRQLATFRATGAYSVTPGQHRKFRQLFAAHRADDALTLLAMSRVFKDTGIVVDPHTAVGLAAVYAGQYDRQFPVVSLACAHAAKFPEAVLRATGTRPQLPARVAAQMSLPERVTLLTKDYAAVSRFVRDHSRRAL
jgi:threonine synthase